MTGDFGETPGTVEAAGVPAGLGLVRGPGDPAGVAEGPVGVAGGPAGVGDSGAGDPAWVGDPAGVGDPTWLGVEVGVASGDPVPGFTMGDTASATGVTRVGAVGVSCGIVGLRTAARGVATGCSP